MLSINFGGYMKSQKNNEFMGTSEAPERWGVSRECVARWCRQEIIVAEQDEKGKPWRIPSNTECPYKIINL